MLDSDFFIHKERSMRVSFNHCMDNTQIHRYLHHIAPNTAVTEITQKQLNIFVHQFVKTNKNEFKYILFSSKTSNHSLNILKWYYYYTSWNNDLLVNLFRNSRWVWCVQGRTSAAKRRHLLLCCITNRWIDRFLQ